MRKFYKVCGRNSNGDDVYLGWVGESLHPVRWDILGFDKVMDDLDCEEIPDPVDEDMVSADGKKFFAVEVYSEEMTPEEVDQLVDD